MTVRRVQVEGIQRLATLLQQLAARDGSGGATAARAGSIEQLGAFLQWLVAEAATLSPDARTEAFWWVHLFDPFRMPRVSFVPLRCSLSAGASHGSKPAFVVRSSLYSIQQ